ncbi:MAG: Sir2 family NAD-dependent protein deacetylase [Deferrisomatales bacterium]|nr:Sir2 family NAD-dependent protein deacetylase [Deferrisomatales bacterium]
MNNLDRAAAAIRRAPRVAVLTGAGISVASGIPDFRSAAGLWSRYDPLEYATLRAFRRDPRKVWRMLAEMLEVLEAARPNAAHRALVHLETAGVVQGIVTQNIDGLHQQAGSATVLEFHGGCRSLSCLGCGRRYTRGEARALGLPPPCGCGALLKPDIVFFGEMIPDGLFDASRRLTARCAVLLVVGTSAEVAPANQLPWIAKQHGATVVELNVEETQLTGTVTDIFVQGPAEATVHALAAAVSGE